MSAFQWIIDNAAGISITSRPIVGQTQSIDGTVRSVSLGNAPWRFDVTMPGGMTWSDARPYISQIEQADRYTAQTIAISRPGQSWLSGYQGTEPDVASAVWTWTQGQNYIYSSGIGTAAANTPVTGGGYRFRAGDFIQLANQVTGNGRVYRVAYDVPWGFKTGAATYNTFPMTGNTTGDFRLDTDSGIMYQWSGIAWTTVYAGVDSSGNPVPAVYGAVYLNRPIIDANSNAYSTIKIGSAVNWTVMMTNFPTWSIDARNIVSWSGNFTFYEVMT